MIENLELILKGLFLFSLGNKLFRFDKRKHLRIPEEFTEGIIFKVNRQKDFHFQCFNISAGGIGLICNPDRKEVFSVNKKFRDVYELTGGRLKYLQGLAYGHLSSLSSNSSYFFTDTTQGFLGQAQYFEAKYEAGVRRGRKFAYRGRTSTIKQISPTDY